VALTIGEGPNRGKSAPPPGRSKPLPKPKPGGASERLSREFSAAIAHRNGDLSWSRWKHPFGRPSDPLQLTPALTAVAPRVAEQINGKKDGPDFFEKAAGVALANQGLPKVKRRVVDYDAPLPDEDWIEHPGEPGEVPQSVFRGTFHDDTKNKERQQIVQNVADQYNVKARLGRRDQARMDREKADRKETEKSLTAEQWNKLSPMQQAAVQANADLMQAVKRDFKDQGKHNSKEHGEFGAYQKRVSEIFGDDELSAGTGYKGLEYAPNTIAFLDKRGIDQADLAGKTLDDLLSGDALIEGDTIKHLAEPTPNDTRTKNVTFAKNLAAGQLRYQENLAKQLKRGDQLLGDITGRDTSKAATGSYGAKAAPDHVKLPAIRPETQQAMGTYMQFLARKDSPLDEALAVIDADLSERKASDEERDQVFQGLIEQTRQASTGSPWFDGIDFPMRTPIEVAKALGAVTLKREGAK
jgi:hypothetical protein